MIYFLRVITAFDNYSDRKRTEWYTLTSYFVHGLEFQKDIRRKSLSEIVPFLTLCEYIHKATHLNNSY